MPPFSCSCCTGIKKSKFYDLSVIPFEVGMEQFQNANSQSVFSMKTATAGATAR